MMFIIGYRENMLYRVNESHWNIADNELASTLILRHLMPQLP